MLFCLGSKSVLVAADGSVFDKSLNFLLEVTSTANETSVYWLYRWKYFDVFLITAVVYGCLLAKRGKVLS